MDTLMEYVKQIEMQWHYAACPVLYDECGQPSGLWIHFQPVQQFMVLLLFGTAVERKNADFKTLRSQRPDGVTWQQVLDASFTHETKQPLNARLRNKNDRDGRRGTGNR